MTFSFSAIDRCESGSLVSFGSVSSLSGPDRSNLPLQGSASCQADRGRRRRVCLRPDHAVPYRGSSVRGQRRTPESRVRMLGHEHRWRRNQVTFCSELAFTTVNLESISPTFHERTCTNFLAPVKNLTFTSSTKKFRAKFLYEKAVSRMLVKLTPCWLILFSSLSLNIPFLQTAYFVNLRTFWTEFSPIF
jgi:hypothetical protein